MSRLFRNHPGYVAILTCILAVSVGVNILVFTVVNALWIRPLPFPEADRVVTIPGALWGKLEGLQAIFEGGVAGQVESAGEFEGLRPRVRLGDDQPDLEALGVTSEYFRVLRLDVRGRDFVASDDRPDAEVVGIISDRLWARAFGRRTDVIGSIVPAKPFPIRVIGVAPPGFEGARRGERADLWIPRNQVPRFASERWAGHDLPMMIFARLGREQTIQVAEQRVAALAPGMFRSFRPPLAPLSRVFGTPAPAELRRAAVLNSGTTLTSNKGDSNDSMMLR